MRRSPRLVGTVALLIMALVVAAILAFQAWDAAQSQRRTAESTLGDYAKFADQQLTQQARQAMLRLVVTSLIEQASALSPDSLPTTVLAPSEVEDAARKMAGWCNCLSGVRYFFRYDWSDGTFRTTETDLPDADLRWVRDTVVVYSKSLPPLRDREIYQFGFPGAQYGRMAPIAVILTNDSYVMLFGQRNTQPQAVVFVVARDARRQGTPVVIYGFVSDPRPLVAPVFASLGGSDSGRTSLLPETLVRGLPADSILSLSVTTLTGTEIYKSPGWVPPRYTAVDTIEPSLGRLVMRVSINTKYADKLIFGGLPQSRLPIIITLFVMAVGLLTVALVQLRRQQEFARLRTEFVSGVSHELRTPLAQIRWFAELLHLGKLRSEDERVRSASIIDQEARRLTYLVENVLNFSRSEKGTNRISPAPADVDQEIREALELFAPLARARKMSLATALEARAIISVDRDALRQVLLNLLDNAAKYGPAGQTVAVGSEIAGDSVRVWVEDQGPGIPHEDRHRVWEPYVRLNREAEAATGGSGIGLSVVRELVALHGGRTRAENAPGGGARLVIELPLTQPDSGQPPSEPAESKVQLKAVP